MVEYRIIVKFQDFNHGIASNDSKSHVGSHFLNVKKRVKVKRETLEEGRNSGGGKIRNLGCTKCQQFRLNVVRHRLTSA